MQVNLNQQNHVRNEHDSCVWLPVIHMLKIFIQQLIRPDQCILLHPQNFEILIVFILTWFNPLRHFVTFYHFIIIILVEASYWFHSKNKPSLRTIIKNVTKSNEKRLFFVGKCFLFPLMWRTWHRERSIFNWQCEWKRTRERKSKSTRHRDNDPNEDGREFLITYNQCVCIIRCMYVMSVSRRYYVTLHIFTLNFNNNKKQQSK